MNSRLRQCQAVTLASTYSEPHRCLKRGVCKIDSRYLCAHHRGAALRARA